MKVVVALDQGTTSSRAIVFDQAGTILAVARKEFTQHFPNPAWVEHDAEEIWRSQSDVAARAVATAGVSTSDIAAVGIANQRETALLWDRQSGVPIHKAIVWQDRRTADACDRLRAEGHHDAIQAKTGLIVDAYFSGTKIAWLLDNVDGARARAERGELAFGTIDTWLIWKLTGGHLHITDASNASRTLLYNIHENHWDPDLLALLNIPASVLPDVRPSSDVYGEVTTIDELAGAVGELEREARDDLGNRWRPAGGSLRPGLSVAGDGQEHLWHRMFHALEHRPGRETFRPSTPDDGRVAA